MRQPSSSHPAVTWWTTWHPILPGTQHWNVRTDMCTFCSSVQRAWFYCPCRVIAAKRICWPLSIPTRTAKRSSRTSFRYDLCSSMVFAVVSLYARSEGWTRLNCFNAQDDLSNPCERWKMSSVDFRDRVEGDMLLLISTWCTKRRSCSVTEEYTNRATGLDYCCSMHAICLVFRNCQKPESWWCQKPESWWSTISLLIS